MTPLPVTVTSGPTGCVRATLNSSPLGPDLVSALASALREAEDTPGVRVFVIASSTPEFCTGMPLTGPLETDDVLRRLALGRDLLADLVRSPLVTVALVDGRATGGGVALAAACDYVIATPAASFTLTELLLGLIPAVLLPVVARRTGLQRAFTLTLTAHPLDAAAAVAAGLADRAATDGEAELRVLLRELGRTVAAATVTLKRYRLALQDLGATGTAEAELAEQAMRERLDDPATRARISGSVSRDNCLSS
ncbi:MAG: enoyl-CoA hydratase-related protein, partial [Frankia sp.]